MSATTDEIPVTLADDSRFEILRNHLLPPGTPCELSVCATRQQVLRLVQRVAANRDCVGLAVLPIEGHSTRDRLMSWAGVVRRLQFTEQVADRAGLRIVARFGAYPRIDAPYILFDLHGPAARYAESELLTEPVRGMTAGVKNLLRRVGGLSAALGGVVMVIGQS